MTNITDIVERKYGTRNWVVARRTKRIVEKYGEDVCTISSLTLRRLEKELEIETMDQHAAYPWLKKLFGNHCDAVNILKGLREEGFQVVKVYGE